MTLLSSASGTSIGLNQFSVFGEPSPNNTGRFGYTGQAWIQEASLHHYRARAYSASLGRFLQPDPIGYGDGLNMYAYVGNDPVNMADPLGLWRWDESEWPEDEEEEDRQRTVIVPGTRMPSSSGGSTAFSTGSSGGSTEAYRFLDEVLVTGLRTETTDDDLLVFNPENKCFGLGVPTSFTRDIKPGPGGTLPIPNLVGTRSGLTVVATPIYAHKPNPSDYVMGRRATAAITKVLLDAGKDAFTAQKRIIGTQGPTIIVAGRPAGTGGSFGTRSITLNRFATTQASFDTPQGAFEINLRASNWAGASSINITVSGCS